MVYSYRFPLRLLLRFLNTRVYGFPPPLSPATPLSEKFFLFLSRCDRRHLLSLDCHPRRVSDRSCTRAPFIFPPRSFFGQRHSGTFLTETITTLFPYFLLEILREHYARYIIGLPYSSSPLWCPAPFSSRPDDSSPRLFPFIPLDLEAQTQSCRARFANDFGFSHFLFW